eukprot:m.130497 g.130497  ORF g.130497 m.130497 type:complete len:555 (+) comp14776_c0_seq11:36-1700(+)
MAAAARQEGLAEQIKRRNDAIVTSLENGQLPQDSFDTLLLLASGAQQAPLALLLTYNRLLSSWKEATRAAKSSAPGFPPRGAKSLQQPASSLLAPHTASAVEILRKHEPEIQAALKTVCEDPRTCLADQQCLSCEAREHTAHNLFSLHLLLGFARLCDENNTAAAREHMLAASLVPSRPAAASAEATLFDALVAMVTGTRVVDRPGWGSVLAAWQQVHLGLPCSTPLAPAGPSETQELTAIRGLVRGVQLLSHAPGHAVASLQNALDDSTLCSLLASCNMAAAFRAEQNEQGELEALRSFVRSVSSLSAAWFWHACHPSLPLWRIQLRLARLAVSRGALPEAISTFLLLLKSICVDCVMNGSVAIDTPTAHEHPMVMPTRETLLSLLAEALRCMQRATRRDLSASSLYDDANNPAALCAEYIHVFRDQPKFWALYCDTLAAHRDSLAAIGAAAGPAIEQLDRKLGVALDTLLAMERVMEASPDRWIAALAARGMLHHRHGDNVAALRALRSAATARPADRHVGACYCTVLNAAGRSVEATAHWQALLSQQAEEH